MKKELLKEKEALQKRLNEVCELISQEISEKHLPVFRKKYNGTYWKTVNGYGPGESWTMYAYFENITEVYDTHGNGLTAYASGYCMQKTVDGTIEFQTKKTMYIHGFTTPCTKEEFLQAYEAIMNELAGLPG